MITKEIAHMLDGTEYGENIPAGVLAYAKEKGVVIVFGASDDLTEFKGAIEDETCGYDGFVIRIAKNKILQNECKNDDCPYFQEIEEKAKWYIKTFWCAEEGYLWTYYSNIPHATFEMTEDGEKYCRGIVFDLGDVPE